MPFCELISDQEYKILNVEKDKYLIYNFDAVNDYANCTQNYENDIRTKIVFIFRQVSLLAKDKLIKDFSIQ